MGRQVCKAWLRAMYSASPVLWAIEVCSPDLDNRQQEDRKTVRDLAEVVSSGLPTPYPDQQNCHLHLDLAEN